MRYYFLLSCDKFIVFWQQFTTPFHDYNAVYDWINFKTNRFNWAQFKTKNMILIYCENNSYYLRFRRPWRVLQKPPAISTEIIQSSEKTEVVIFEQVSGLCMMPSLMMRANFEGALNLQRITKRELIDFLFTPCFKFHVYFYQKSSTSHLVHENFHQISIMMSISETPISTVQN